MVGDEAVKLLAIDPGPVRSALIMLDDDGQIVRGPSATFGIERNERIALLLAALARTGLVDLVLIEKVESFGMPVGVEVLETVYWTGRFAQAALPLTVRRIGRKTIKIAICGSVRAKDANIRAALLDRYGGKSSIGTKKSPGPLYGVSRDLWSALALAIAYQETTGGSNIAREAR